MSFDRDILSLIELGGNQSFFQIHLHCHSIWCMDFERSSWAKLAEKLQYFRRFDQLLAATWYEPHRRVEKCITELCETYSRLRLEKWWSDSVQAVEISLILPLRYQDQGVEEIEWAFVKQGLYRIAIQEQPCLLARWCRTIGLRNYLAPSNVLLNKPRLGSTSLFRNLTHPNQVRCKVIKHFCSLLGKEVYEPKF